MSNDEKQYEATVMATEEGIDVYNPKPESESSCG